MKLKLLNWISNLTLLVISTFITFSGSEFSYRLWLKWKAQQFNLSYRVAPSVYIEYDEQYGERIKPNAELWVSYVENGQVVWGTIVSRSNQNGLGGKTTIEEYNRAEIKILVFGDSFTHWNQDGVTWPDILERNLSQALQKKVAVVNYARGTYGILQMLDLAADKVEEHHPDIVIIAAIGNDFTRARWWCKEIKKDGITRWIISSKKDEFLDYRFAVDELLIHPEATRKWCKQRLATGGKPDAVLEKINAQFVKLKLEVESIRRPVHIFTLNHFYLWNRLTMGTPFETPLHIIPEISFQNYNQDAKTQDNLRRLKATGIQLMLIYLPIMTEIKERKCIINNQTKNLISSLEHMAGTPFRLIQLEYQGEVPTKIDLHPYDGHPNREGLQLYADATSSFVLDELQKLRKSR